MPLISMTDCCADRSSLALLSAYQEYLVTCKLMISQLSGTKNTTTRDISTLGLPGLCVFFSKLCTIFWRIVRLKSGIMRKLCELRNIFSEKLNAFCNKAVAICSAPSCDCFGRHGKWKNNLATKFYKQVANLATGAVEKTDCSSTGFFPNITTKPNELNHNFCILVFLTCFFLLFTFLNSKEDCSTIAKKMVENEN